MTVRETIRASLGLLDRRDRRLLGLAVLLQMATSLLDLIGVALIGLVGTLSMSAVQGQHPPKNVMTVVSTLGLGGMSDQALLGVLSAVAAALLLIKSVVSPVLMARVFRFLARRQALVSARLSKALLSRPLTFVQQRSSQVTAAALLSGANAATVLVLGQTAVAASEVSLLTVLAVVLMLVNPAVAVAVIAFFGLVGFGLQKALGHRAARLSAEGLKAEIASLSVVQEALGAYREITVADRRSFYVERIQSLRVETSRVSAGQQVFGMLAKYVSEGALVLGAFSLAAVLFTTLPVTTAAGTFALFLATATRVMPSLLRLQGAALTIRTAAATAAPTFELAAGLGNPLDVPAAPADRARIRQILHRGHPDFVPSIKLHNVSYAYPGAGPAIHSMNMTVSQGQSVALIGRSGAGKSTLADLILGVLQPDSGEVAVGGVNPNIAVQQWSGGIAYVPQDVVLANDSVRGNVALGLPTDMANDDLVWDALRRAHLADYVHGQPDGLDSQIGERGLRLSGGQRQRLGIARALFTRPQLLVLDEATSALDAETERSITATLDELDGDVTTVIIAHRLSTIRNADVVVYLDKGQALAVGTFDQVCETIPALQRQAALMGLRTESV